MNSIATAIFLGVSVTDHSCKPNAVATFEGTTLHIHAIEDIECLDWSKVFTVALNTKLDLWNREYIFLDFYKLY